MVCAVVDLADDVIHFDGWIGALDASVSVALECALSLVAPLSGGSALPCSAHSTAFTLGAPRRRCEVDGAGLRSPERRWLRRGWTTGVVLVEECVEFVVDAVAFGEVAGEVGEVSFGVECEESVAAFGDGHVCSPVSGGRAWRPPLQGECGGRRRTGSAVARWQTLVWCPRYAKARLSGGWTVALRREHIKRGDALQVRQLRSWS